MCSVVPINEACHYSAVWTTLTPAFTWLYFITVKRMTERSKLAKVQTYKCSIWHVLLLRINNEHEVNPLYVNRLGAFPKKGITLSYLIETRAVSETGSICFERWFLCFGIGLTSSRLRPKSFICPPFKFLTRLLINCVTQWCQKAMKHCLYLNAVR